MRTKLYLPILFLLFVSNVQLVAQTCTAAFTVADTDLTIQFTDASTHAPGDPIVSWAWDFDDGGSSSQQNPVHTFDDVDKYDVVLTITTQSGCQSSVEIEIEICVLSLNVNVGDCDPTGNIPLVINVSDAYDNAKEVNISIDGNLLPGSPFDIDDDAPVMVNASVSGDGLNHTILVQSDDIGTCNEEFSFTAPDCSSDCFLSALDYNFSGGGSHTVAVGPGGNNSFAPTQTTLTIGDVVNFNFVDDGHTTTSDATSGPDSWNSGQMGVGSVYPVTLVNPGVHPYYCIPHGGPGGSGMAGTLIANCPGSGNFTIDVNFSTTQANAGGFTATLDGVPLPGSPFSYNGTGPQNFQFALPGDGSTHTLEVIDVDDPSCDLSRTLLAPDCGAAPACTLSATAVQTGSCDGSNNVTVEVEVTAVNGGAAGFQVLVDGVPAPGSPFPYAAGGTTVVSVPVSGDGQAHTLSVNDVNDSNCTGSTQVTTSDCTLSCTISALSVIEGTATTHIVAVEDFEFVPVAITISVGDIVEWQWTGDIAHTATSDATSGPDSWDSGLLNTGATYQSPILSAGVHPYYCVPHGAPGGVGMAGTITVQADCTNGQVAALVAFSASGGGFGGYEILVDGQITSGSPYAYASGGTNEQSIFLPGDGQSHTIIVRDADDPGCSAQISYTTPDCNAPTCQLTATATENGGCNSDDTVPVDVSVNATGGGSGFSVLVDGNNAGNFTYATSGSTIATINVPGDGNSHNIEVIDNDDANCSATTQIITTNCVIPCQLSNLTASTGGGTTHTVAVEDFEFVPQNITISAGDIVEWQWTGSVAHTATSDATSGPDSFDSGLLGNGATYQSPVLSAGVHPYYCAPHGAPGGVGMAGTITVQADCTNGMVGVNLNFASSGGGFGGYDVLVDGTFVSNHVYDAGGNNSISILVAGDGQSHTILVRDAEDNSCAVSTTIATPDCNAPTCQLTATATENGPCNSDDTVPVDVSVNATGGGSGFSVLVDGNSAGNFSYGTNGSTIATVNVPGDGNSHNIEVIDNDDANCSATTQIITTNCVIPCQLSNLTASTGGGATHTVAVEDFEFVPQNITISAGDIVEWQWTGSVAHTATSDATSGPDSFDSGLLGNGATYQSPVLSAGVHPYYCAPHGAPGGVGMVGTITVQADCTNGMVGVNLNFASSGGGFSGYDVLVDGTFVSNHAYDANGNNSISILVAGDGQSHTILVRDAEDNSCAVSTTIATPDCNAPTCQLTATATENGGCNSDDTVPVDVSVNATGGGSGFSILVDGNSAGNFTYATSGSTIATVNVPGDGNSHSIEVIDNDDPNCSAITQIITTNCVIPCQLSNLTASTGGGATHTVAVEDFEFVPQNITISAGDIVEWQWTGSIAHTATSDATSGPDSFDSGLLGNGATYQSPVLSAGVHPYYCAPHGAPGGVGMAGTITVQADCTNGMVGVNLNFASSGGGFSGYDVLVDGTFVSNHAYDAGGNNSVSILVAGDGQSHSILVRDTEDNSCSVSTTIATPDCNAPTCQLTATATENGGCNSDDTVPVDVSVNATGGGSGFSVLVDGNSAGNFTYATSGSTMATVNVPGDGNSHNIEVIDHDDANCSATTQIITTNCVIPCQLSNLTASTGGGATHTVAVEDFEFVPQNITISAGDIVEWQWTGSVAHTATSDATSGPDSFDSGLLGNGATYQSPVLSAGVHPYYCAPHGAPGGVGMAGTITVQADCTNGMVGVNLNFASSGGGFSGYDVLVDGTFVSNHAYDAGGNNSVSILVAGDGQSHTILVRDAEDNSCAVSTTIATPDCNAPTCQLTATATENGGCNSDDTIPVDVGVNATGGGSGFSVLVDGNNAGNFTYTASGSTIATVNVPGDGNSHSIEVIDNDDANCSAITQIVTTNCIIPCQLSNLTASTGGGTTHTVAVEDFEFVPQNITISAGDIVEWQWTGSVAHTATSDATSGPDSFDSGLLGNGATYQSPILSAGVHPYYCAPHGAPGGVGMAGTITVQADCTNGMVGVNLNFASSGGGFSGYDVLVDGTFVSNHAYDAGGNNSISILVAGDGQSHTILVRDAEDNSCAVSTTIATPDCNASTCQLTAATQETGDCDADENVTVELTLSDLGGGAAGFSVTIDGAPAATLPYSGTGTTNASFALPGDGAVHEFSIADLTDPSCTALTQITTSDCTVPCFIHDLNLTLMGDGNPQTHIVLVEDFEFSPSDLTVQAGDVIEFQWTGNIDHTTTSDVQNAAYSWDSDLLSQGATYQITLTDPGEYPYYCIPHGTPGGVGMAGNISVEPAAVACDADGNVTYVGNFEAPGVGDSGYELWLDGQVIDTMPYSENPFELTLPGDGNMHVVVVSDVENLNCLDVENIFVPDCGNVVPCSLMIDELTVSSCAGDATVEVTLSVEAPAGGTSAYNLFVDGTLQAGSPFSYQSGGSNTQSLILPASGQTITIALSDVEDHTCGADTTFTLPTCGGFCEISDFQVTTDPVLHSVEVRDFDFFPATLEVLPGDTIEFFWTGNIPHTTTSDALSGPSSWDSPLLNAGATYRVVLDEVGSHPYYCIPHGGPGGIGMAGVIEVVTPCDDDQATIAYSFDISFGGPGGYNVFLDGNYLTGPIDYQSQQGSNSGTVAVPADGNVHLLTVQDTETNFCAFTTQFTAPICSEPECSISALSVDFPENSLHLVEVRDFDFFPPQLDVLPGDTIRFIWTGQIPHTTTSDATSGPNAWDSGLLDTGDEFDLILNDPGDYPYYCIPHGGPGGIGMAGTITVGEPDCADGMVTAELSFISAEGNSGAVNVFVDDILTANSPFPQMEGSNSITLQLPGDGGTHTIIVADLNDASCADTVTVVTEDCLPPTCTLNGTVVLDGDCNADNEVPVLLEITHQNSGDQFTVSIDGNAPQSFDYANGNSTILTLLLPGDGQSHSIEVTDSDDASCNFSTSLTSPDCSPPECSLELSATQNGNCDANGNVDFSLNVTATAPGTQGFQILVDGNAIGDVFEYEFPQSTLDLSFPGDGTTITLEVVDVEFGDCSDAFLLTLPLCGTDCEIDDLIVTIDPPEVHTVEVEDFQFNPVDLSLQLGDTIRFVWTGDIPHTATSDDSDHPDAFNSGLLGSGSTFDVIPTVAGVHPYYCIPHGAPGGVGMAGSFTVAEPCDDGQVSVQIEFAAEGGGAGGYSVLLDGNLLTTQPYGDNSFSTTLPAGGQSITLTVQDADDPDCAAEQIILLPDCNDPCFGFEADFETSSEPGDLTVEFNDLSTDAIQWLWEFGNGDASTLQSPTYTYLEAGTFEVCLTATDAEGCSDQTCQTLDVGEYVCQADFEFYTEGLTIFLENTSQTSENQTNWTWNFGDNFFAGNVEQTQHTYDTLGIYTVCLTVNAGNCTEMVCQEVDLSAPCTVFSPGFTYAISGADELTVQFVDQTAGAPDEWLWGFGEGNTTTLQNPEHTYATPGAYNVCLLVQNTSLGCNATLCEEVAVGPVSTDNPRAGRNQLVVFPNPVERERTSWSVRGIAPDDYGRSLSWQLYDSQGRLVRSGRLRGIQKLQLEPGELSAAGLYWLQITSDERIYRSRVVVQ